MPVTHTLQLLRAKNVVELEDLLNKDVENLSLWLRANNNGHEAVTDSLRTLKYLL
jgi:hypothetical protein